MDVIAPKKVYEAINQVSAELATVGISKARKNQMQGYVFRGIDDIYNALSRALSNAKLVILPRVVSRECIERINKSGGAIFYVTVGVDFDFVSAEDGSMHTITTYGEAMDSSDKATNKAMSAAYKYAAMQAFCIPTEGDNDADAHTPEVAAVISTDQTTVITDLLAGRDTAAFLAYASKGIGHKITAINQIPASAYDALIKKLEGVKNEA